MRRYLLDTNTMSDLVYTRRGVLQRVMQLRQLGHVIGTTVCNVAELYSGLENSLDPNKNRRQLVHQLSLYKIWPFTTDCAEEYGRIYAYLRRVGRPMQQVDMMMAAVAITLGNCVVVTTDSDLLAIPNLTCENWQAP